MRIFSNAPGDLRKGYYDRLLRRTLSRLVFVPQEVASQLLGEEFSGERLETPQQRVLSAVQRRLPIGVQGFVEAIREPKVLDPELTALAQWTGATFWPARTLDKLNAISHKDYGVDYLDAEDWQRQEILLANPDLKERGQQELELAA